MTDESAKSTVDENPYEPGDAAVAMKAPERPVEQVGQLQIAASNPPDQPTISRAFENFAALLRHIVGTPGYAWIILIVVQLATTPVFLTRRFEFVDLGAIWWVAAGLVAVVDIGACIFFTGLNGALRTSGFFGAAAVPTVGDAYKFGMRNIRDIGVLLVVGGFTFTIPTAVWAFFAFGVALNPAASLALAAPLFLGAGLLVAPLFYIIPSTDKGLVDSAEIGRRIATTYPFFIIGMTLIAWITAFSIKSFVGMASLDVILAGIVSYALNIVLNILLWVSFVATFATIEEAEQGLPGGFIPSNVSMDASDRSDSHSR